MPRGDTGRHSEQPRARTRVTGIEDSERACRGVERLARQVGHGLRISGAPGEVCGYRSDVLTVDLIERSKEIMSRQKDAVTSAVGSAVEAGKETYRRESKIS